MGRPISLREERYRGGGEEAIKSETTTSREKARRVLQAVAVEAYGRPGAYVTRDPVMQRAGISRLKEFRAVAGYLAENGWISEADNDYGIFVITAAGVEEATS